MGLTACSDSTLEATYRKQTKGHIRKDKDDPLNTQVVRADSPFHAIHFHRVILDEAHSIKVGRWSIAVTILVVLTRRFL